MNRAVSHSVSRCGVDSVQGPDCCSLSLGVGVSRVTSSSPSPCSSGNVIKWVLLLSQNSGVGYESLNKTICYFWFESEVFHLTDWETSSQPRTLNFDICVEFIISVMDPPRS